MEECVVARLGRTKPQSVFSRTSLHTISIPQIILSQICVPNRSLFRIDGAKRYSLALVAALVFAFALPGIAAAPPALCYTKAADDPKPAQAENITSPCQALKGQLKNDPDNVALHEEMTRCLFDARLQAAFKEGNGSEKVKEIVKVLADHVLWLVQHAPGGDFDDNPGRIIDAYSYPEDHERIKREWLKQVEAQPGNAKVLAHAANFLSGGEDLERGRELAAKAHSLDPQEADVSLLLAHLEELQTIRAGPQEKTQLAKQAFRLREEALNSLSGNQRFSELPYAAKAAIKAGDMLKAQDYAEEMLRLAPTTKDWGNGEQIYYGNWTLGLIALNKGNMEEAKTRLLEAGKTPGSPVLGSFGPNMELARQLIEKHETEAVLKFFDECEKFWKRGHDNLNRWRGDVNQGKMPEFGANLNY